jgi:hypothetical protein
MKFSGTTTGRFYSTLTQDKEAIKTAAANRPYYKEERYIASATEKIDENTYYSPRFYDASNYNYTGVFLLEDDEVYFIAVDKDGNEFETNDEPEFVIDLTKNKSVTQFEMHCRTNGILTPEADIFHISNIVKLHEHFDKLSVYELFEIKLYYERNVRLAPDMRIILELATVYYEKAAEAIRMRILRGVSLADINSLSGKEYRFFRKDLMAVITGTRLPIAKCGITALEETLLYIAGLSERRFEIPKHKDDALRNWLKKPVTQIKENYMQLTVKEFENHIYFNAIVVVSATDIFDYGILGTRTTFNSFELLKSYVSTLTPMKLRTLKNYYEALQEPSTAAKKVLEVVKEAYAAFEANKPPKPTYV